MRIGVPKETKTHEYRVGLTPTSVRELTAHGHEVIVEAHAGAGIGASDAAYRKAGAKIGDPWAGAELVVKVKEPQGSEHRFLRSDLTLFTYLHLANEAALTDALVPVAGAPNLFFLPTGELPPNPAELLASERIARVLSRLQGMTDLLILDSPPIGAVSDAAILAAQGDSVLLVLDTHKARKAYFYAACAGWRL